MSTKAVVVLLVEDDVVDVRVATRAFDSADYVDRVVVASDGEEALGALRNGDTADDRLVVLLDLNMPGMSGLEFLDAVREDPELAKTVVFVLTTSNDAGDKEAAYRRNVAGYIVKSETGDLLEGLVEMLERYQQLVEFPQ